MKRFHIFVYLVINLIFVIAVHFLKTGSYLLESLMIVFFNFFIVYFIMKQTIFEVSDVSETLFKVENIKSEIPVIIKQDYGPDLNKLMDQLLEIRNKLHTFSKDANKPLTTSLEAILNSTLDGIIVVNNERDIIMANDSFFRLCGYRAFEISGKDSTAMVSPENVLSKNLIRFIKYSFENSAKNMDNVSTGVIEIAHVKPPKTLKATATPMKYNPDTVDGMVINLKDITKELEAESEKKRFISNISHEFRTPLFSIMGYANLLLGDENFDEKNVKNFIKTIYDESLQLSDIIDNLLNVLILDREDYNIKLEEINIKELTEEIIKEFSQKIKGNNSNIIFDFDPEFYKLYIDKEHISIILKNIISNAIKFSFKDKDIIISSSKRGNSLIIGVTNFGAGISENLAGDVFKKFFRAESLVHQLPGTGLGLFITMRLAKLHGGDIDFESKVNEKTTFYVNMPIKSRFEKDKFDIVNLPFKLGKY